MAEPIVIQPTALELFGRQKLAVKKQTIAAGQPSVLEFEEDCKTENFVAKAAGRVTYTDPDLGAHFDGYVIQPDVTGAPNADESVSTQAADLGRTCQKQPAYLMCKNTCPPFSTGLLQGTEKFHILAGTTVHDAVTIVTAVLGSDGLRVMNSCNVETELGALVLLDDLDKGGMSVAEWLDAIVDQTPGGTWFTRGNDVYVVDYYKQADVALVEGQYGTVDPGAVNALLVVKKQLGESTNNKFRCVRAEGLGHFKRFFLHAWNEGNPTCAAGTDPLNPSYNYALGLVRQIGDNHVTGEGVYNGGATNNWTFNFRIYLPHTVVMQNFFNAQYVCSFGVVYYKKGGYTDEDEPPIPQTFDDKEVSAQLTQDNDPFPFDVGPVGGGTQKGNYNSAHEYNPGDVVFYISIFWVASNHVPVSSPPPDPSYWTIYQGNTNPRHGWYYVGFSIPVVGDPSHRPGAPHFDSLAARYSAYLGPMSAVHMGGPRLAREGEYPIMRPDLLTYSQDEVRSPFTSGDPPVHVILEPQYQIDGTSILQQVADLYAPRFTGDPHVLGKVTVHIPTRGPGLAIAKRLRVGNKLPLYGQLVRVRQLDFDYEARNVELSVSTIALRDDLKFVKDQKVAKEEQRANWRDRIPVGCTFACFPEVVLTNQCRPADAAVSGCATSGSFDGTGG